MRFLLIVIHLTIDHRGNFYVHSSMTKVMVKFESVPGTDIDEMELK